MWHDLWNWPNQGKTRRKATSLCGQGGIAIVAGPGEIAIKGFEDMTDTAPADDLAAIRGLHDFEVKPIQQEDTTEYRAAEFKRRITVHLQAVKQIMDDAKAEGFSTSFNVSEEVNVTLTKTF